MRDSSSSRSTRRSGSACAGCRSAPSRGRAPATRRRRAPATSSRSPTSRTARSVGASSTRRSPTGTAPVRPAGDAANARWASSVVTPASPLIHTRSRADRPRSASATRWRPSSSPRASSSATTTSTPTAGPSIAAAHASRRGSTVARGDNALHPLAGSTRAAASSTIATRWVTGVPVRGVRIISRRGGGARPPAMSSSVAARVRLPRAIWYTLSAVTASAAASTAASSHPSTWARVVRRASSAGHPLDLRQQAVGVGAPRPLQHEPVELRAPGDRLVAGDTGRRGDAAQVVDQLVERRLVQPPFDVVAEQHTERDPLTHAVEEPIGEAHAVRREHDRVRAVLVAAVGEVRLAQQCRRARLVERRCEDEAGVVGGDPQGPGLVGGQLGDRGRDARPQLLDPAVAADHHARRLGGPQLAEPSVGERGHPGVEAERGGVESGGEQPLDPGRVGGAERRQRGTELAQRSDLGGGEVIERAEVGGDGRAVDATRQRLGALPGPAGGGLGCGHEVDQLGVEAQLGGVAPAGREQPGRRLGVLAQQGVARQRLQQRDGRGLRRGEAGRVGTEQRPEVGERAVGVTGEGHTERGAGVLVHEQVETDRSGHTGAGGQVRRELAQDGEEADRVEVRAEQAAQVRQVVRTERTAHVVAGAGGASAEHVDDVGAGIVAAPDPGGADGRRPPHLVAQRRQQAGEAGTGCGVVAGGRPAGERRDGQHAVGLTTAAQRRQRTGRAQVATGVVADPAPRGVVERRELRQVVAPGGRPQRGLHRLGDDLVALAGAGDAPERRLDPWRGQPERGAEVAGAARRAQFGGAGGGGLGPLDRKGLLAAAVATGVAGALGTAVVGGRARREERQAVGEMVGVEQGGHVGRRRRPARRWDADHHEDVDGGRVDGAGQHHPQRPSRLPRRGRSRPSSACPRRWRAWSGRRWRGRGRRRRRVPRRGRPRCRAR